MVLFFADNKTILLYFTDHASSPWSLLPPFFSLTIKNNNKEQVTKKVSEQDVEMELSTTS